jgi:DNA-binding NarL/FixJ family response regulator
MESDLIRVIILAPTLAVRVGLRTLLSEDPSISIIAEAASFEDLEDDYIEADIVVLQGDILIEDFQMRPDIASQPAFLFMTDDPKAVDLFREPPVQSWGILPVDATQEELLAALNTIILGFVVLPAGFVEPIWANRLPVQSESLPEQLTPRESEVLQLVAQGLANKQIALALEISEHTVKFHISSIYGKIGATNRTEAVRIGLQVGIISL